MFSPHPEGSKLCFLHWTGTLEDPISQFSSGREPSMAHYHIFSTRRALSLALYCVFSTGRTPQWYIFTFSPLERWTSLSLGVLCFLTSRLSLLPTYFLSLISSLVLLYLVHVFSHFSRVCGCSPVSVFFVVNHSTILNMKGTAICLIKPNL